MARLCFLFLFSLFFFFFCSIPIPFFFLFISLFPFPFATHIPNHFRFFLVSVSFIRHDSATFFCSTFVFQRLVRHYHHVIILSTLSDAQLYTSFTHNL
jgi:hypothetical protein